MPAERDWLTTQEAAAELGLAPETIRWAKRAGLLKVEEISPRVRAIRREELERYRREHLGRGRWAAARQGVTGPSVC